MSVYPIEPEPVSRHWMKLATLLSMDVVLRFYDLMGLRPANPHGLQTILRQEIITARERWRFAPDHIPLLSRQAIVQTIAQSLGPEASRHLVWWGEHIFSGSADSMNLEKWHIVLATCRRQSGLWSRLLPDARKEEALDRFRKSRTMDEYNRRQEALDLQPLSDWDLHLYALHLYDDNLYDDKDFARLLDGPQLWVLPTIRDYQGYQFWAWVLKVLSSQQIDQLWHEACQIAEEEELHAARNLPHPSVLGVRQ